MLPKDYRNNSQGSKLLSKLFFLNFHLVDTDIGNSVRKRINGVHETTTCPQKHIVSLNHQTPDFIHFGSLDKVAAGLATLGQFAYTRIGVHDQVLPQFSHKFDHVFSLFPLELRLQSTPLWEINGLFSSCFLSGNCPKL